MTAITLPIALGTVKTLGVKYDAPETVSSVPGNGFQFPKHKLGDVVLTDGGAKLMYCQAGAAITGLGFACLIDVGNNYTAAMVTTANSSGDQGMFVGFAQHAFATSDYGWLQISGPAATIQCAASAAAATSMNTTTTPGVLGTDATTGSRVVNNCFLASANGGTQGNVGGWVQDVAAIGVTH